MKTAVKLFFLLFIFVEVAYAQPAAQLPAFLTDSLDLYVTRALADWQIPGVAVCVVKDGQPVVMKGYGLRELGKPEKVDEHTLFMIGSNTKAFTGTALALLAHEEKCSLDDKVKKWLPEFRMYDPWVEENAILTDLVSHRLGMETFQGDFMYFDSDFTTEEIIRNFGKLKPLYDFRTKWGYCNAGFLLAGQCIERISGDSWAETLRKRLFEPLEMNRTLALSSEIGQATNKAAAHTLHHGELKVIPYGEIDPVAPAGSISSSIHDMSHWLMAQLSDGKYKEQEVIPADVIRRARRPESIVGRAGHPFNRRHFELYAMGWQLEDYEGREIVSHTGGIHGFVTSVTLLPEENLGIVVLTNTDQNYFFEALKWDIVDAFLELPYRGYSQAYNGYWKKSAAGQEAEITKWRDTVAMNLEPALPLEAFVGKYVHEVYGNLEIVRKEGGLWVTFEHHPGLSATLEPMGGNRFLCTYNNPLYGVKVWPFAIEEGKVAACTLRVNDFIEFLPYEFIKQ
ncbi:MAG: serine hydrolase [Phaeodactylibacter sp.]|nr:serine hydrolase [Phaeodactylibacter sp.]MCB9053120.1 serine hydrolase [Lewinellaceae bacterium]